jgi:hypothetical protein
MKRWLVFVVLAVVVGGCKSMSHPPKEKVEKPAFNSQAPDGNGSPFQ